MKGVLAFLLALAAPLGAQDTTAAYPQHLSYFPYLTISPNDGAMAIMRAILFRQARDGDRVTLHDAVAVEAGYSIHDSWRVAARGDFPRLADGWRAEVDGWVGATPRFGDPDVPQALTRQYIGGDLSRSLGRRAYLAVRLSADHRRDQLDLFDAAQLYPATPVSSSCPTVVAGLCPVTIDQTDLQGRVALVVDTRDREFDTHQGALLQAGFFDGSGGGGYHGTYAMAAAWAAPLAATTVTARAGYRDAGSASAIGIQQTVPAWENDFIALGGAQSDRALAVGQDPGQGLLLAGAEIRHVVLSYGNIAAVSAIVFIDGGRTFRDSAACASCMVPATGGTESFRFTLQGWTVGAGGGVAVRVLRNAQLTLTAARANRATRWYLSSGWAW